MKLPEWPPRVRDAFTQAPPTDEAGTQKAVGDILAALSSLWYWWQDFKSFMNSGFSTRGNIELMVNDTGIIFRATNGTKWKLTVDNTGNPVWTSVP